MRPCLTEASLYSNRRSAGVNNPPSAITPDSIRARPGSTESPLRHASAARLSATLDKGETRGYRDKRSWIGQIAQLVEHRTENPGVAGSIPALPITYAATT